MIKIFYYAHVGFCTDYNKAFTNINVKLDCTEKMQGRRGKEEVYEVCLKNSAEKRENIVPMLDSFP